MKTLSPQPPETPANTIFLLSRLRSMDNADLVALFRQAQKLEADLYVVGGSAWAMAKINAQNAENEIRKRAEQKRRKPAAYQTQLTF